MPVRTPSAIRNVALMANDGVGKTSLIEALLYDTHTVDSFRRLTGGPSILDSDDEERKRNLTLHSQVYHLERGETRFNFIDTPGFSNFIVDVRNCLNVAEACLLVADAVQGVREPAGRFWALRNAMGLPGMLFVNRMDEPEADFEQAVDAIQTRLRFRPVAIQWPMGSGPAFEGVIDLVTLKAFRYAEPFCGRFAEELLGDPWREPARKARDRMIEAAVEFDDALMEKYLDGSELTEEEISGCLRKGFREGALVPVLVGSARANIGLGQLLDEIERLVPSPVERAPFPAHRGDQATLAAPRTDGPFLGVVFKTTEDHYQGRVNYVRVVSGVLTADAPVVSHGTGHKEKAGGLGLPLGHEIRRVDQAFAGDIVAIAKTRHLHTGQTLSSEGGVLAIGDFSIPNPVIGYAISLEDAKNEEKIFVALHRLCEEDPTLRVTRNGITGETLLEGMGQLHIDVAVEMLKRKFGVELKLRIPQVPYHETLRKAVQAQGRYKRQTGGRGQYGDCHLLVEPLPRGGGFEFIDRIVGGVIPRNYLPAVEKGVKEAMARGVIAGYPMTDLKVTCFDGSYHEVDSSDMAFQIAGSMALKKAAQLAGGILLEPVMALAIDSPDGYVGAINGDVNSRRGRIVGMEPGEEGWQIIHARVPLAELATYAPQLRSLTHGEAGFTMEMDSWEEVPQHLAAKIIESRRSHLKDEEE